MKSEEGHEYRYLFDSGSLRLEHRVRNRSPKRRTDWASMPFWGEGPERERAIALRAERAEKGIYGP